MKRQASDHIDWPWGLVVGQASCCGVYCGVLVRRLRRPAYGVYLAAGAHKRPPAYFVGSAISNSAVSPKRHGRLPPPFGESWWLEGDDVRCSRIR